MLASVLAALAGCGSILGLDDLGYQGDRPAASDAGVDARVDASPEDAATGGGDDDGAAIDGASPDDAGGPRVITSQASSPQALTVDATNLYWVEAGGAVKRIARDGSGLITTIATGQTSPI